ncbi:putative E3 ubiquitin-protein ligase XBAT35 isoform X2 [Manihot esculenta]|uniref:putative E3 ubiquitin-protein ligase XBAT35 isoform X2 n=1 Tax=Manihot esculenta TaxID=3983 RepID=UPI001CC73225|nr:putative E3 ubiquitin-protein ligase XBAT35 isoform X2 [Manihot esculenta]
MGQSLDSMSQNQSKEELLYQLLNSGNVEAIKALCREGANLEWIDKDGKTPLIVACMDSGLFNVAKTLIEMGANVNAYRPGRHAGTPLHHAAKRGLKDTVVLLLSSGANALVRNDDCHTALDVARIKGHTNVVRAIENRICYFSGWLREFHGPGFLKALTPQLLSRKMMLNLTQSLLFGRQKLRNPNFISQIQGLPYLIILQVVPPPTHHDNDPVSRQQESAEALDLAMALSASIQSATEERPPLNPQQISGTSNANGWERSQHGESHNGWSTAVASAQSEASSSGWTDKEEKEDYKGWGVPISGPLGNQGHVGIHGNATPVVQTSGGITTSVSSAPSAPPIPDEVLSEGPIHYPVVDFSPVDSLVPPVEHGTSATSDVNDGGGSSSCIICWEAPVEGACIPCGHMAGCMACLSEIKGKKGVCPVCRTKINQIIRLYAV